MKCPNKTPNAEIFIEFTENALQGLGIAELDGTIIYYNKSLQNMLTENHCVDLCNHNVAEFYPEHERQKLEEKIFPEVLEKGSWEGALSLQSFEGKITEAVQSVFLIRDAEGKPKNIANVITDISRIKQEEREKAELQKQLMGSDKLATIGKLAAGMAHEINEPLNAVLGFAELIKKDKAISVTSLNDLEKIIEASLHARKIIKEVLIFSRQADTQKEIVSLNKIIEEGLYLFERQCAINNIEVVYELSEELPFIEGDSSQIQQVLVNIVLNAMNSMPGGGRLVVKTYATGDKVFLVVKDNGIGMSETTKKRAFDPFFTTRSAQEGTGLGLSVVYGIVSMHNGKIKVDSELGKGSRFEIMFPGSRKQMPC